MRSCSVGPSRSACRLRACASDGEWGREGSGDVERFLQPLQIAGFDDGAAAAYGPARAALEKKGVTIGPIDMLLAAQALSLGVTLVTNNTQEFRRVKGLKVQDWTR